MTSHKFSLLLYAIYMFRLLGISLIIVLSQVSYAATPIDFNDENTYLPRIKQKKWQTQDDSMFDDVRLHAGVSYINSYQDFMIAPGIRERAGTRGFDLNFGVDLFSPNWIAEGHVINLPENSLGDTRLAMNGFELRLLYDTPVLNGVTVHGGVGLGSRYYTVKTSTRLDRSVLKGERSFQSAATVLVLGADYWPNAQVSFGAELTNHLPMANGDDPSSVDLNIKLSGHF